MKPAGVRISGSRNVDWPEDVTDPKAFCARSASLAKPTLITPIARASHQNTSRGFQSENGPQITRDQRRSLEER